MSIARLIYRSIADKQVLNTSSLLKLENQASNNNRKFNISGLLILSDGRFLQVLEGEPKFVNKIYNKIVQDKRHHDVELISYERVTKHEFNDWSMKLFNLENIAEPITKLLVDKYPFVGGKFQIMNDLLLMTSFLLDVKNINELV